MSISIGSLDGSSLNGPFPSIRRRLSRAKVSPSNLSCDRLPASASHAVLLEGDNDPRALELLQLRFDLGRVIGGRDCPRHQGRHPRPGHDDRQRERRGPLQSRQMHGLPHFPFEIDDPGGDLPPGHLLPRRDTRRGPHRCFDQPQGEGGGRPSSAAGPRRGGRRPASGRGGSAAPPEGRAPARSAPGPCRSATRAGAPRPRAGVPRGSRAPAGRDTSPGAGRAPRGGPRAARRAPGRRPVVVHAGRLRVQPHRHLPPRGDPRASSATRWATPWSQGPTDSRFRTEPALRASSRKVTWNASSAACGSRRMRRQTPSTIGPCRPTRSRNAAWSHWSTKRPRSSASDTSSADHAAWNGPGVRSREDIHRRSASDQVSLDVRSLPVSGWIRARAIQLFPKSSRFRLFSRRLNAELRDRVGAGPSLDKSRRSTQ